MPGSPESELTALRDGRDVSFFDLHSIDQVSKDDLELIFAIAKRLKELKTAKLALGKGHSVVHAFFEASTRTQSSFDLAAKHLSMDTTSVSASSSSTKKGESFIDTVETLSAYNASVIVIRTADAGAPEFASRHVAASIVSAGDGWHEHPTQALLDAYTMFEKFGTLDLSGRVVTIVGDAMHSRVFGSLMRITKKLGATVRIATPQTLLPVGIEHFGIEPFTDVDAALAGADVVYTLRIQEERGANGYIPTMREYSKTFGINERRIALAKPDAILMDPGPVIRDIQLQSALVSRHPQSRILDQVENGMAVRKALLWLLAERVDGKRKSHTTL